MLNQYHVLEFDDLQFGFKAKSSTVLCTAMLMETIKYYNHKNSDVHLLLIDASKAFDRVNFVKLFELLYDRHICPVVLCLIMNMYIQSSICVRWQDQISQTFPISNGVKQGGVLSPILFNVYMDNLLLRLRNCGLGCHVGPAFAGAFGYADDLALLAPTVNSLKYMINICEKYASEFYIKFNTKKSKTMYFNCKDNVEVNNIYTLKFDYCEN